MSTPDQCSDHLQRRLAQGHIWSLPLCTITALLFLSAHWDSIISKCLEAIVKRTGSEYLKLAGGGKIFDEIWKQQMDGNDEVSNRGGGGDGGEKRIWCSILFLRGLMGRSYTHGSKLASAELKQYDRRKGHITDQMMIRKHMMEQIWAFHWSTPSATLDKISLRTYFPGCEWSFINALDSITHFFTKCIFHLPHALQATL